MRYLIITLFASAFFTSCNKGIEIDAPNMETKLTNARSVSGDTLVFKLGDTCKFSFNGYADNLMFYSGLSGVNYEFRSRRKALGIPTLSFSSTSAFGTQTNTLKVLATKSLSKLDSASIVNANWTDITSRAVLATSATAVASGSISLADLVSSENDSLVIAFKYNGLGGTVQRTWTITNFLVNNVLPDISYNLSSLSNDANYWTRFKTGTSVVNWTSSTSQLQVVGGVATNPSNESWIVTKPLYVGRVSPDVPTAVLKSINSSELTSYLFKYAATGVYKATFVSSNHSLDNSSTNVKQFIVKVIP